MNVRPVAVVALLALAGCSGLAGPQGTPTPLTPAPVPSGGDSGSPALAPGVERDGSIDADRLARAHRTAVENTAYQWHWVERRYSTTLDRRYPNRTTVLTVESERRYHFRTDEIERRVGDDRYFYSDYQAYADGERRYLRYLLLREPGGYTYERQPVSGASVRYAHLATDPIRRYLAIDDATIVRRGSGTNTRYVIRGTTDELFGVGPVRNFSVRAVVTPKGFVSKLDARYVAIRDNRRRHDSFTYTEVGETAVDRPDWVTERWDDV